MNDPTLPHLIWSGGIGVCEGLDAGDGRCIACTLPMVNHPVTFTNPQPKVECSQ